MVFVGGSEIIFGSVQLGVDASGLGEEVAVALGVLFRGAGFGEGEPEWCFLFFAGGSVFGSDQVFEVED